MIEPKFDLVSIFLLIGLFQAFFLSIFFLSKRLEKKENLIAGILLVVVGFLILDVFLEQSALIVKVIYLYNVSQPFALLLGPLFYLWISRSLKENVILKRWIHLLPFFLYLLYYSFFYLQPDSFKEFSFARNHLHITPQQFIEISFHPDPIGINEHFDKVLSTSLFIYLILSVILIKKAKSRTQVKTLERAIWLVPIAYTVGAALYALSRSLFDRDIGDFLPAAYLTGLIYLVSAFVMKNSPFFKQNGLVVNPRYKKSPLPKEVKLRIEQKLRKAFEKDKIFLHPGLNIAELSTHLNTSAHHISQVLNESIGQNFFDFVAKYRVEEASKLLRKEEFQSTSVEIIAEMVGYYSKSAFIVAFKKLKGNTPSNYRKSQIS